MNYFTTLLSGELMLLWMAFAKGHDIAIVTSFRSDLGYSLTVCGQPEYVEAAWLNFMQLHCYPLNVDKLAIVVIKNEPGRPRDSRPADIASEGIATFGDGPSPNYTFQG